MTLALFVTLAGALTALVEIVAFTRMRRRGRLRAGTYPVLVLASLVLPAALWLIFTRIVPELGATVLF